MKWKRCQVGVPFVWTFNVRKTGCKTAARIARRAAKKFCEQVRCPVRIGDSRRGQVTVNGWKCKVMVYHEGDSQRCRKGVRRLYRNFGV